MGTNGGGLSSAAEDALFAPLLKSVVWLRDAQPDVWGGAWGSSEEGRIYITVGVTDCDAWEAQLRATATRPDRLRVVEVARSEADLLQVYERWSRWIVKAGDDQRKLFVDCTVDRAANAVVAGVRRHDEAFERRARREVDAGIVFELRAGEYRPLFGPG